jgi:hypothetical protein
VEQEAMKQPVEQPKEQPEEQPVEQPVEQETLHRQGQDHLRIMGIIMVITYG